MTFAPAYDSTNATIDEYLTNSILLTEAIKMPSLLLQDKEERVFSREDTLVNGEGEDELWSADEMNVMKSMLDDSNGSIDDILQFQALWLKEIERLQSERLPFTDSPTTEELKLGILHFMLFRMILIS